MLPADSAATPESRFAEALGSGLGTRRHLVPFQCAISVSDAVPPKPPTAQASLADSAATPYRTLIPAGPLAGLGLGTCRHLVPPQCAIRVLSPVLVEYSPTAQMLRPDVPATASSTSSLLGLGLSTCCHLVPFQCTIRVWSVLPTRTPPTAQALQEERTATPLRELPKPLGLGGWARPAQVDGEALPGAPAPVRPASASAA